VHATISGVVLGLIIPYKIKGSTDSPLWFLEHGLQPWTAFLILPLFAFVNAGVNLQNANFNSLLDPVTLGITLGLFLGKQIGVFSFAFIAIRCGLAKLPEGTQWMQLYGGAVLCGIGFTMSLFIASLSFDSSIMLDWDNDRLGILLGSVISGIAGFFILRSTSRSVG
jgi:NhaA family Na+:H+ antiporter